MNHTVTIRTSVLILILVAVLVGCNSKSSPEQVDAIGRVEAAKAAYSRELQPALDALERCMSERTNEKDSAFCGKQMAATPKPSSAEYDLALRMCLEKGVSYEHCTGKIKYK